MRPILIAIAAAGLPVPAAALYDASPSAVTSNPRATDRASDQTAQVASADEVICRREGVIGSRVQTRRTCRTHAEWVRQELQTRESINDLIRRSTSGVPR